MYGKEYWGIERTTFLIDTNGTILKIYPKVKVDDHHHQVLKDIKAR
jgi:peroxiredoxin Q/BCP